MTSAETEEGGLVKCGHMRTGGGGSKGPCGRPQAGTSFDCFSMLCRHSLCGWCLL